MRVVSCGMTTRSMSRQDLGAAMHHWHSSQSDPVYAVGSQLYAGQPVDEEKVKGAREKIRSLLRSAKNGAHGWGAPEVEELNTIEKFLGGLLRTYAFGEMPTLADFRRHLAQAKDAKGRRLISSSKPILTYDLTGDAAQAAETGYQQSAQLRRAAGKSAPDMRVSRLPGGDLNVQIDNIESLYDFIRGIVAVGDGSSRQLASNLMDDLGYNWTATSR